MGKGETSSYGQPASEDSQNMGVRGPNCEGKAYTHHHLHCFKFLIFGLRGSWNLNAFWVVCELTELEDEDPFSSLSFSHDKLGGESALASGNVTRIALCSRFSAHIKLEEPMRAPNSQATNFIGIVKILKLCIFINFIKIFFL